MTLAAKTSAGPTILLNSGAYFDLLDPWNSDFVASDIAHGLSHTCRYAGQCSDFYSVAEHSVLVSQLVPLEDAFAGLMHDAAEAFIGDVTRPLKMLLPDYKRIEAGVEDAIAQRFGLPMLMPESVKRADLAMLAAEQTQIMPAHADDWACLAGVQPAPIVLPLWKPAVAKRRFMARFSMLTLQRMTAAA